MKKLLKSILRLIVGKGNGKILKVFLFLFVPTHITAYIHLLCVSSRLPSIVVIILFAAVIIMACITFYAVCRTKGSIIIRFFIIILLVYMLVTTNLVQGKFNNDKLSNKFYSETVGFEITKPSDWHFLTVQDNIDNLKRVDFRDPEFKELIVKYSTRPLVVMTKYAEPFNDLNPSIKVVFKPFGSLQDKGALGVLEFMLSQLYKVDVFNDLKVVQKPTKINISGIEGAYMRINYNFIVDKSIFPVISEMRIIPQGNYYFMVGFGVRQDEKTGTIQEVLDIISSIIVQQ